MNTTTWCREKCARLYGAWRVLGRKRRNGQSSDVVGQWMGRGGLRCRLVTDRTVVRKGRCFSYSLEELLRAYLSEDFGRVWEITWHWLRG